jgi:hypothetical protein
MSGYRFGLPDPIGYSWNDPPALSLLNKVFNSIYSIGKSTLRTLTKRNTPTDYSKWRQFQIIPIYTVRRRQFFN